MRILRIFLFLFITVSSFAQGEFSSFINYVYNLADPAQKNAAIDSFFTYARLRGIPFIEGNTANFMYRANKNTVQLAGDFTDWNPAITMNRIPATNFFYYSRNFELNARLDYKIVADGQWILDPENPHKIYGGYGPNSELAMPGYVQPWEVVYNSSIPHGTLKYHVITSSYTGFGYNVSVYLPPAYDSSASVKYPSSYFQDGSEYINLGSAVNVIDNLINRQTIEPVIGIFVKPANRELEYAADLRNQYRMFFINEMVPFIDSLYNTERTPSARIVSGDSWGGNISALISYNHADVFGNCGLHSAAFWPNNYEAFNLVASGPKKDIRFAATWGTYESLYSNMRSFRDTLYSKGYELAWSELPEGHSWGQWRANIDFLLQYFIPGPNVPVNENVDVVPGDFRLQQNYPNPFNPSTRIIFSLDSYGFVSLKVYNSVGEEIENLVSGDLPPGIYNRNFDARNLSSGVYFYRLQAGSKSETRKMILLK